MYLRITFLNPDSHLNLIEKCGGTIRLFALIKKARSISTILVDMGLPTGPSKVEVSPIKVK